MARKNPRGKREFRPYNQLPKELLRSPEFWTLSGNAVKVLLYLLSQYYGSNNGDLSAPKSVAGKLNMSEITLRTALTELLDKEFIAYSRVGGNRVCHLYYLTFFAIDECLDKNGNSKLDVRHTHTYSDAWKRTTK